MAITYRGVSQSDIASSLEKLSLRLLDLEVGPLTTAAATFWMSEGGMVAQIRTATDKAQIEAALQTVPPGSTFSNSGWLSNLYSDLLPNVFSKANPALQSALTEEINAVSAWNGFWAGGRFHAFYPEDAEVAQYCKDVLGMEYTDTVKFSPGAFHGPYNSYQVYAAVAPQEAIALIVAYAKAQGADDECVQNHYGDKDKINLTPALAYRVVDDIAQLQALGRNGYLITKKTPPPPPAPKR